MTHTPHDLHDEFPDAGDILHRLKLEGGHFTKISDEYHEVNREIHRIEVEVETTSDQYLEGLKKRRLSLLDQIGSMITKA